MLLNHVHHLLFISVLQYDLSIGVAQRVNHSEHYFDAFVHERQEESQNAWERQIVFKEVHSNVLEELNVVKVDFIEVVYDAFHCIAQLIHTFKEYLGCLIKSDFLKSETPTQLSH